MSFAAARLFVVCLGMAGACPSLAGEDDSRLVIDATRRVYALSQEGVEVTEPYGRGGRRLVALPGWIRAKEPYACPPDLALAPDGSVVVTSNVVPVLWRIDRRTLAASAHPVRLEAAGDRDIGLTSLRWSRAEGGFVAGSGRGEIWAIDAALSSGRRIQSSTLMRICRR